MQWHIFNSAINLDAINFESFFQIDPEFNELLQIYGLSVRDVSTTIWRSKAKEIRTEHVASNFGGCALKLLFFLDPKWSSETQKTLTNDTAASQMY